MNIIAESLKELDKHLCEKLDAIIDGEITPDPPITPSVNDDGDENAPTVN